MPITKAILTGGGRATRLRPITTTLNKHLIPLANKPMIFHAIEKAVEVGIKEIFINTNPGETELQKVVGDGSRWGIAIKYFEQEGGPQGIAHVVKCAERFIGDDPFMFYLSDNIILGSLWPLFEKFGREQTNCQLAFARMPDVRSLGVPVFDAQGQLVDTLEKPQNPPNNFAITGIYLFGAAVFFKAFEHIKPSARGEYEIPDVVSYLLKNGCSVGWEEITGWWKDTGKPEDLIAANQLLLDQLPAEHFEVQTEKNDAVLTGNVHIGKGTWLGKKLRILGPALIGENCALEYGTIGPYVTIGSNCTIKNVEITQSIIFDDCTINAPIQIAHSIIGAEAVLTKNPNNHHRLILGDHTVIEV